MKKILKDEISRVKLEIRNRYIAGESVPSIANDFGVVPRTIYFHLGELNADEKGLHAKNSSLRRSLSQELPEPAVEGVVETIVETQKEEINEPDEVEEEDENSLVDFIQS